MVLQWSKDLAVGHPIIDSDHQMLINIANNLAQTLDGDARPEAVNCSLGRLAQYIETHFKREEELFMATRYPHKEKHQQNHRNIEQLVREFQASYGRDPAQVDVSKLLNFFKDWLVNHIGKQDKGYAPYVIGAERRSGHYPAVRTGFV